MRRADLRRAAALAIAALVGGLSLTACRTTSEPPRPLPSPSASSRPFTVISTDRIRVADPAAVTDAASAMLTFSAFQRLMTADAGQSRLRPDAARDCVVTAPTAYTCTLRRGLKFANGHELTSSDVKFSIQRAVRLNVSGSSTPQLASLRRIETPDPLTARFVLSRVDSQFGWALASPAASIVDEESYDPDQLSRLKSPIAGSGPMAVASFDGTQLVLSRYDGYLGRMSASIASLAFRSVADSVSVEDAMAKGEADVVWRGLDAAAVTRLAQQVASNKDGQTDTGFRQTRLTGTRILQLIWSPTSPVRGNKAVRRAVAEALQADRTSDSVVPGGVVGHVSSFPAGGRIKPKVAWRNRINLILSYDPTAPNALDLANQVRGRIEAYGGLSVQLHSLDPKADLSLVDRKAWTATPLAWLQPYLGTPLPGSKARLNSLVTRYRAEFDETEAEQLLTDIQEQAAADRTVVPLRQDDDYIYVRDGVTVSGGSFGPGWQFGLAGISNG